MLFSAAVVLSTVASALAGVHVESGSKYSDRKLVARADVKSQNGNIHVQFEFDGKKNGDSTFVKIRGVKGLTNDPSLNGPFAYHIHTNPVPADGNCTKTLAHLDPLDVTTGFICNPNFPQYCESGDLSGKHGKLNGTPDGKIATFGYSDAYVRFFPEPHSILGRSIVIHAADKTRIACGNIISPLDGTAKDSWKPTGKPSKYVKNYPTAAPPSPGPAVVMSNGTEAPDQSKLPYRLPIAALPLSEAVNVNLTSITHTVKIAGVDQTVTQPKEYKIDGTGPFKGEKKDDCDW